MKVRSLCWEDPLEEGTATHSSILAWRIPWTEEPGGLPSIRLHRVGHDSSDLAYMQVHLFLKKTNRKDHPCFLTKQKQTHRHRVQNYGHQRGKDGEREKLGIWDY